MKKVNKMSENKLIFHLFFAYLFKINLVVLNTSLGFIYFRFVRSMDSRVRLHGLKCSLKQLPDWVKIVHYIDVKKKV